MACQRSEVQYLRAVLPQAANPAPNLAKDSVSVTRLRPLPFGRRSLSPWPSARSLARVPENPIHMTHPTPKLHAVSLGPYPLVLPTGRLLRFTGLNAASPRYPAPLPAVRCHSHTPVGRFTQRREKEVHRMVSRHVRQPGERACDLVSRHQRQSRAIRGPRGEEHILCPSVVGEGRRIAAGC